MKPRTTVAFVIAATLTATTGCVDSLDDAEDDEEIASSEEEIAVSGGQIAPRTWLPIQAGGYTNLRYHGDGRITCTRSCPWLTNNRWRLINGGTMINISGASYGTAFSKNETLYNAGGRLWHCPPGSTPTNSLKAYCTYQL